MKKLIEALQFISQFMKDPDCEYPTTCEHDEFYIWDVDLTDMTYQDVRQLLDYGFMPGTDDEYDIALDYLGECCDWDNLTEEGWLQLRDQLSSCVHSFNYGSC